MSHRLLISIMIWWVWWIGLNFCIFEGLAIFWHRLGLPGDCPWYTFSRTDWHIERAWWPFQFVFLFATAVLMVHIFEGGVIKLAIVAPKKFMKALKESR